MDEKDLIYLVFAESNCYESVVQEKPSDIEINIKEGKWTHKYGSSCIIPGHPVTLDIGEMRHIHCNGRECGIIGVYDRTNLKHLDAMVNHALKAQKMVSGSSGTGED